MTKTIETIDIQQLVPHPKNPRKHGEKQIAELVRSYEKYGQYRDVVIDETNTILAGHGLIEAMKVSGAAKAKVIRFVGLSPTDKTKLLLSDNRTQSLGADDHEMIYKLINEISDYDIPGFDEDLISAMMEDEDAHLSMIQDSMDDFSIPVSDRAAEEGGEDFFAQVQKNPRTNGEAPDEDRVKCPHCGTEFPWP